MNPRRSLTLVLLMFALSLSAQTREPHLGYVYPAGGCRGATFEVVVGGQFLNNVSEVYCSGGGVKAEVIEQYRPMPLKRFTELRDELNALQPRRAASRRGGPNGTNQWTAADERRVSEILGEILKNPPNRQGNPALAERVSVKVTLAPDAEPGRRELRVLGPNGLSNPLVFCIGDLREFTRPAAEPTNPEIERLRKQFGAPLPAESVPSEMSVTLPAVVNGQILPGGVGRFRFFARRGQKFVAAASARTLMPYLADAVPGWFQATVALFDARGNELKYEDDFQFRPDPVMHFTVPRDGEYVIEIKDAIYRGREDFVYRIELGELPFLTGIFPLGATADTATTFELSGWNLPVNKLDCRETEIGTHWISQPGGIACLNRLPFAVAARPDRMEQEPNETSRAAQTVVLPLTLNGRIGAPGDRDVFRFEGRAGQEVVAEVLARRLESPLDSVLTLTDASGVQIAFNDDSEDKASGLNTHHADSYVRTTLPRDGMYYVTLAERQGKGGTAFAYRLRLGAPEPDFELRLVPSAINARIGASVPVTVHALRKDGFTNEIKVLLSDAPSGFTLRGGVVPSGTNEAKLTLTVPASARAGLVTLRVSGEAVIQGRRVIRPAVPADDLMQAFLYRHLVPAQELKLAVSRRANAAGR